MEKKKEREIWVDYTKTFACILVVIGHLLQGLNMAGIEWNTNLYYYINKFIYIFHMPLFMCLSGYLYKKTTKILNCKEYFAFVKKKIINLSVPYFVFYISHVLINMFFSSSVNSPKSIQDILNILTNPIPPFWFLYALLFIFILMPIIEYIFKKKNKIILAVLALIHIININIKTDIYGIDVFAEFSIYFYTGVFLNNLKNKDIKNIQITLSTILFLALGLIYCFLLQNNILNINILNVVKFILAIYGTCLSILLIKKVSSKLEKVKSYKEISKYTFQIYLMHTIFSAGIRICLIKINMMNFYIHFIMGIIAGTLGPIIVAKILEKIKYGNIIIYPLNTLKQLKSIKKN